MKIIHSTKYNRMLHIGIWAIWLTCLSYLYRKLSGWSYDKSLYLSLYWTIREIFFYSIIVELLKYREDKSERLPTSRLSWPKDIFSLYRERNHCLLYLSRLSKTLSCYGLLEWSDQSKFFKFHVFYWEIYFACIVFLLENKATKRGIFSSLLKYKFINNISIIYL